MRGGKDGPASTQIRLADRGCHAPGRKRPRPDPAGAPALAGGLDLVLTGSTEHSVITRAHELGVRYLLKPFNGEQLKVHVEEARARRHAGDRRVSVALDRWTRGHALTDAETALLALGARGVPREEFAIVRGVRPDTIRKQIQSLLMKTGDDTFEGAVNSLLREAVSEPH